MGGGGGVEGGGAGVRNSIPTVQNGARPRDLAHAGRCDKTASGADMVCITAMKVRIFTHQTSLHQSVRLYNRHSPHQIRQQQNGDSGVGWGGTEKETHPTVQATSTKLFANLSTTEIYF